LRLVYDDCFFATILLRENSSGWDRQSDISQGNPDDLKKVFQEKYASHILAAALCTNNVVVANQRIDQRVSIRWAKVLYLETMLT
jgi:hypothetical protein